MSTTFRGKLGEVSHHLLDSTGNAWPEIPFIEIHNSPGYQELVSYEKDYYGQSVSEGWPYINIAQSANQNKMHVKVYADNQDKVDKYEWNFGDNTPVIKTINKETEHVYDLSTKDDWLTYSGNLPIRGLEQYTGRWTNVALTVTNLSGYASTRTLTAFVYELVPAGQTDLNWQIIDAIPNSGGAEEIQATKSTGEIIQTIDF
jgi:hypothetical protein